MPVYRLQIGFFTDSMLPRDIMQINPHFLFQTALELGAIDAQNFVNDARDAMVTYAGGNKPISVKMYDAQGTPPVVPVATATGGGSSPPSAGVPREVSLCLSYFSTFNRPSRRGRLYVPGPIALEGGSASTRPNTSMMQKVGALATILANLGGANVDWCVYSTKNDAAYSVSDWWVDDEWDTIRSRGLRSTTRLAGAVNE